MTIFSIIHKLPRILKLPHPTLSKNTTTSILQIKITALNKNNNINVNANINTDNSNSNNNNNNRICDVAKTELSDKKILKIIFVKVGLEDCFFELREITVQKVEGFNCSTKVVSMIRSFQSDRIFTIMHC